jgi:hypothetical protein
MGPGANGAIRLCMDIGANGARRLCLGVGAIWLSVLPAAPLRAGIMTNTIHLAVGLTCCPSQGWDNDQNHPVGCLSYLLPPSGLG